MKPDRWLSLVAQVAESAAETAGDFTQATKKQPSFLAADRQCRCNASDRVILLLLAAAYLEANA